MNKIRYKLIIEYLGTNFVGFQKQNNGFSIQEAIESALLEYTKQDVTIYAAGRTDAGVHARGQVIHFDLEKDYSPDILRNSLNHFIKPHYISILSCEYISNDFHARFSAKKRYYEYIILNRISPPVIDKERVWHIHNPLNVQNMKQAAKYLIGTHDFSSFRATECQARSPIKTLDFINITNEGEYIKFNICATSFLHHMVRNIVGTLKLVGENKIPPEEVEKILLAKNRIYAGMTAPASGLYFLKVDY